MQGDPGEMPLEEALCLGAFFLCCFEHAAGEACLGPCGTCLSRLSVGAAT